MSNLIVLILDIVLGIVSFTHGDVGFGIFWFSLAIFQAFFLGANCEKRWG